MNIDEIINQLGEERENYYNAVSPPIIQTSNFAFKTIDDFRKAVSNEKDSHIYTRGNNPTVKILRTKLAALEKMEDCLVFSSGSAAVAMAVISAVKQGDHIVCVKNPYSWTVKLLEDFLQRFGVSHTYVDGSKIQEIEAAIQTNTKVLYLESPNTATFAIQDLKACGDLAKSRGIITMIDNSYCSPIFQNPSIYGIDVVIHSGTKYLNGHSDVVVGAVCASKAFIDRLFINEYMTLGAILSPFDAQQVIRGLRTLPIRMKRIQETTEKVVTFLKSRDEVSEILYPWDEAFAQSVLMKRQATGAGGLFSIILNVEEIDKVEAFVKSIRNFLFAVSWGGHESLILPFVGLFNIPNHPEPDVPFNLVRISIGLEEAEFLIEGLEAGFKGMNTIDKQSS